MFMPWSCPSLGLSRDACASRPCTCTQGLPLQGSLPCKCLYMPLATEWRIAFVACVDANAQPAILAHARGLHSSRAGLQPRVDSLREDFSRGVVFALLCLPPILCCECSAVSWQGSRRCVPSRMHKTPLHAFSTVLSSQPELHGSFAHSSGATVGRAVHMSSHNFLAST